MKGAICVFSLKNPSYPEFVCYAPCGVVSVDINPAHPHMMLVGLANGNVAVYNLQKKDQKPSYMSTARNGKHRDIVWQVCYPMTLFSFRNDAYIVLIFQNSSL